MKKSEISNFDQEKLVEKIRKKPGNQNCADCGYSSPSWASLDFGTLICYECSGVHRKLGPRVSRVRSLQLDKWSKENLEMMWNVGNIKANEFWEFSLSKGEKENMIDGEEKKLLFISDKYVNKLFIPTDNTIVNPVQNFLLSKHTTSKILKENAAKDNNIIHNVIENGKIKYEEGKIKLDDIEKKKITKTSKIPMPPAKDSKPFSFDWEQAIKVVVHNTTGTPSWKNFKKDMITQNIHKNRSAQNLRAGGKEDQNYSRSDCKEGKNSLDFDDFKAVSQDLRGFLLNGNPLDQLKKFEP